MDSRDNPDFPYTIDNDTMHYVGKRKSHDKAESFRKKLGYTKKNSKIVMLDVEDEQDFFEWLFRPTTKTKWHVLYTK